MEGTQREHDFSEEATEREDARPSFRGQLIFTNVVDRHRHGIVTKLAVGNDALVNDICEFNDTFLLSQTHASFLTTFFGSLLLSLLLQLLINEVFTPMHLSLNRPLMLASSVSEARRHSLINKLLLIVTLHELDLNLLVEGRHEVSTHREFFFAAK